MIEMGIWAGHGTVRLQYRLRYAGTRMIYENCCWKKAFFWAQTLNRCVRVYVRFAQKNVAQMKRSTAVGLSNSVKNQRSTDNFQIPQKYLRLFLRTCLTLSLH